jgi:hypothetical protein
MKGKKTYVATLMTLTGALDDQGPLDDAREPANTEPRPDATDGSEAELERKTLEEWLAAGARLGFNPADPRLRAKYFWAVREIVAGRATGSIDHPAFVAYGELIKACREQQSRRDPVPLRAGGGMVEALDQVTLLKMMPTLRALSTMNGSH